jgi:hypothetical protein
MVAMTIKLYIPLVCFLLSMSYSGFALRNPHVSDYTRLLSNGRENLPQAEVERVCAEIVHMARMRGTPYSAEGFNRSFANKTTNTYIREIRDPYNLVTGVRSALDTEARRLNTSPEAIPNEWAKNKCRDSIAMAVNHGTGLVNTNNSTLHVNEENDPRADPAVSLTVTNQCKLECPVPNENDNNLSDLQKVAHFTISENEASLFSSEECRCRNELLIAKYPDPKVLEEHKSKMRGELESFMLGRAGQEIIRDFAINLENVNYYQTNDGKVFRTKGGFIKKGNEKENSRLMQCNDVNQMNNEIAATCPSMNPIERKNRINQMMNGLNSSSDQDLAKYIDHHTRAILVARTPEGKIFTRDRYDEVRRSISLSSGVKFIDHIMAKFLARMSKEELRNIADQNNNELPEAFLTRMLADEYSKNPR